MDEVKVLKQWKQSLYIFFGMMCVMGIAEMIGSFFVPEMFTLESGIRTIFAGGVQMVVTNYFAFKKRGTKWIGFLVFTTPVFLALQAAGALLVTEEVGEILITFAVIAMMMHYWWNCVQLYKLNRRAKQQTKALAS